MKKIIKLDNKTIENIAAGEIINRPVSIIKELVENSIDAGATDIVVEIKRGGKDYIRVTDNGSGIFDEDLPNVFKKHFTSKITNFEDLFSLDTRGFRGEALNSIQNVSEVSLSTKTHEENVGLNIKYSFGEFVSKGEAVTNYGTTIESSNLFKNMPVRRDFLASDRTEENQIISLIETMAVAYYSTSFRLISNGRTVINTSGSGNLKTTILEVYDLNTATKTIEIDKTFDDYKVYGLIGNSDNSTVGQNKSLLFVNGRITENKELEKLIDGIYYGIIPKNRRPVYFIFLTVPKNSVDVNIHPSKKFVKFNDFDKVKYLVESSIYEVLKSNKDVVSASSEESISFTVEDEEVNDEEISFENQQMDDAEDSVKNSPQNIKSSLNMDYYNIEAAADDGNDYKFETDNDSDEIIDSDFQFEIPNIVVKKEEVIKNTETSIETLLPIDGMWNFNIPLGIVFNNYFLIENKPKNCMIVVNIKNAIERSLYDKINSDYANKSVGTQTVLEPFVYNYDRGTLEKIEENIEILSELGFDISIMGENTVVLHGVPSLISDKFIKSNFDDLVYTIEGGNNHKNITEKSLISSLSKIASNSSRLANVNEIKQILYDVLNSKNSLTSPQGKNIFTIVDEARFIERLLHE